jgi:hypothetical protein
MRAKPTLAPAPGQEVTIQLSQEEFNRLWKVACALETLQEISKLELKSDNLDILLEFTNDAAWKLFWELDRKMDAAKGLT